MKYFTFCFVAFISAFAYAIDLVEFGNKVMYFYSQPTKDKFEYIQDEANASYKELEKAKLSLAVEIARISDKNGWPIKKG